MLATQNRNQVTVANMVQVTSQWSSSCSSSSLSSSSSSSFPLSSCTWTGRAAGDEAAVHAVRFLAERQFWNDTRQRYRLAAIHTRQFNSEYAVADPAQLSKTVSWPHPFGNTRYACDWWSVCSRIQMHSTTLCVPFWTWPLSALVKPNLLAGFSADYRTNVDERQSCRRTPWNKCVVGHQIDCRRRRRSTVTGQRASLQPARADDNN